MSKDITKDIQSLFLKFQMKESIERQQKELQTAREDIINYCKDLLKEPELKAFIDQKLVEADERLHFNEHKNKDKQRILTETYSSCSTDGKPIETKTMERLNPNGWFVPSEDKYEIISFEQKGTNTYRIGVDNIKGRTHMVAFMWIPDEYYTDWFEL